MGPGDFRRSRPVIARLCRSLFRHEVGWLTGVLLAGWFVAGSVLLVNLFYS
jgi:hypothetical protein